MSECATPRPWIIDESGRDDDETIAITTAARRRNSQVPIAVFSIGYSGQIGAEQEDNPAFVLHAVNSHDAMTVELTRLRAQVARLREALKPFADVFIEGDEDYPDNEKATTKCGRSTDYSLTLGDFRRAARAAYEETGK